MIHNAFATPGRKTTLEGLRQRIDNRIIRPDVLSRTDFDRCTEAEQVLYLLIDFRLV